MVLAYARTHANDGAQVKRMFDGRAIRAHNNIQFIEVFVAINYAHHDTILRGIL
jgi:hypothetical protein